MLKDIDPKKFSYEQYTNRYYSPISEREARDQMTDYHYVNDNPLLIRTVDEKYYFPGPNEKTNPVQRRIYDRFDWYHSMYDGKYGQKTEIQVRTEDISNPDLQDLVVAMAVSKDFTLQEALYAVANACQRCRMVLMNKYAPEHGGYSDMSDEYYKSTARCRFCKADRWWKQPTIDHLHQLKKDVQVLEINTKIDGCEYGHPVEYVMENRPQEHRTDTPFFLLLPKEGVMEK